MNVLKISIIHLVQAMGLLIPFRTPQHLIHIATHSVIKVLESTTITNAAESIQIDTLTIQKKKIAAKKSFLMIQQWYSEHSNI